MKKALFITEIEKLPIFQRYIDKYSNPYYIYMTQKHDKIIQLLVKKGTYLDIMDYLIISNKYHAHTMYNLTYALESICKRNNIDIPVIEGILTPEYWNGYACINFDYIIYNQSYNPYNEDIEPIQYL